ncbi:MAG: caspase family protein [Nannocystales bacterium]
MNRFTAMLAPALLALGITGGFVTEARAGRGSSVLPLSMRMPTHQFALVIGSNATLDSSTDPLRFADDDAAAMAELLTEVGYDVALVTTLDVESQALHPDLVRTAFDPSPKGLEVAWTQLRKRMEAVEGEVELVIYYSGHGDVGPDGQGYLTLSGGKLTRNRLFSEILEGSPADHNHVLIDACRSEQFVLARGKKAWKDDRSGKDAREDVGRYLGKNHLGGHPDTGVIVAHSADQQTHEWERYRGGIFTHQLLSGLRGGADLNGDGAVEYSELGAFVAAANSGVKDPRARLSVTVRPPAEDQRQPVLRHDDVSSQRVLYFPEGDDQRLYTVEDARGVRLADLRRAGDRPGYLRLPEGDMFVSRRSADGAGDAQEATIPADILGRTEVLELSFKRTQRASRGALDQAFRAGLFSTPYGPGYYSGYTDTRGLLGVADPKWRVEVWEVDEDGKETKVSETEVEAPSADEALETEILVTEEEDTRKGKVYWGSLFFGTVITPFNPQGRVRGNPRRVIADQAAGCLSPFSGDVCTHLRGFELRWQLFSVGGSDKYPRWSGYLRTGYEAGRIDFTSLTEDPIPFKQATSLSYVSTPLWLGANLFLLEKFPLRPFAGVGVGTDGLRVRYTRQDAGRLLKRRGSGNIGFEVHTGLEVRITNWVTLSAEVRQAWVTRQRYANLPDVSTQGLTVVTGLAIGFPFAERGKPRKVRTEVRRETVIKKPSNPMRVEQPEPPTPPAQPESEPNPQLPAVAEPPEPPSAPPPSPAPAPGTSEEGQESVEPAG